MPEHAYSRAILGVYEMTRVELLRDLYVRAYERSTQEYLTVKQELAEPDPLRLAWGDFIKQTIHDVVVEELRRLHEGVLARFGLRPSEYTSWKAVYGH